jgi:hypothetical protein
MSADISGISERDVSSDILVIPPKNDSSVFIYTRYRKFFRFNDQPIGR